MFGCFDNFVPCNNTGVPDHTPMNYALHHLERLLQSISTELREKVCAAFGFYKLAYLHLCTRIRVTFTKP